VRIVRLAYTYRDENDDERIDARSDGGIVQISGLFLNSLFKICPMSHLSHSDKGVAKVGRSFLC
jgi:hypothetical protein